MPVDISLPSSIYNSKTGSLSYNFFAVGVFDNEEIVGK